MSDLSINPVILAPTKVDIDLLGCEAIRHRGVTIRASTLEVTTPDATSSSISDFSLSGWYRLNSAGIIAEVEFINRETVGRTVFVVKGNAALWIRLTPALYAIKIRWLLRPGIYGAPCLTVTRSSWLERADLFLTKALRRLTDLRGLSLAISAGIRLMQRSGDAVGVTGSAPCQPLVVPQDLNLAERERRARSNDFVLHLRDGDALFDDAHQLIFEAFERDPQALFVTALLAEHGSEVSPHPQGGELDPLRVKTVGLQRFLVATRGPAQNTSDEALLIRLDGSTDTQRIHLPLCLGRREFETKPNGHLTQVRLGVEGVSIVIPTRDRLDLLAPNIEALKRTLSSPYEIIIVDNGSVDPNLLTYFAEVASDPRIRVISLNIPFNFSKLCNFGVTQARQPMILLLNDDIEAAAPGWYEAMAAHFENPRTGIVGARLVYPGGALQHCGIATNLIPGPGHPWRNEEEVTWKNNLFICAPGRVDAVTGACLLIRKSLYSALDGLDETHFAITLNDVDLCLKARRKGLDIVYEPAASLIHKEGQTRPDDNRPDQRARREAELRAFYAKYPEFAERSLFYPLELRRDTDRGLAF